MSEKNYEFELPDKPSGKAIKSVREQLVDLDGVERAKILESLYGMAMTGGPSDDYVLQIAVNTTNNSAYIIKYSIENGWEGVEEISPTRYWKQHTLATVNE